MLLRIVLTAPSLFIFGLAFAIFFRLVDDDYQCTSPPNLECVTEHGSMPVTALLVLAACVPPFVALPATSHAHPVFAAAVIVAGLLMGGAWRNSGGDDNNNDDDDGERVLLCTAVALPLVLALAVRRGESPRVAASLAQAVLASWALRRSAWDLALAALLSSVAHASSQTRVLLLFATLPLAFVAGAWWAQNPWRSAGPVLAALGASAWACSPLQSGAFDLYSFAFVWPTLERARLHSSGGVEIDQLPALPASDAASPLRAKLDAYVARPGGLTGLALLDAACRRIQPGTFWTSMLHGWAFLALLTVDPLLLNALLSTPAGEDVARDAILVCLLSLSMLVRVSCMEVCFYYSVRCMAAARSAVLLVALKRALFASALPGNLANLVSGDADKLGASGWVVFFLAQWTYAVLALPATVAILATLVGARAALAGVGAVVVGGLVSQRVARCTRPAVRRLQAARDDRASLVRRVVDATREIKLGGVQDEAARAMADARERELAQLWRVRVLGAANALFGQLVSQAVPVAIFGVYTRVEGRALDSATAFASLALVSQIAWSVGTLPDIFNLFANLKPSGDRLAGFFACALEPPAAGFEQESAGVTMIDARVAVGDAVALFDVSLCVRAGELAVVTGPVGAGKTSLLLVAAGARRPLQGVATVCAERALVEQTPFLLNGSIEDNVVFLAERDDARLRDALERAQLLPDLAALADGARTLVGEAGVQLSGGQRVRVALARALYARARLVVMDDVLAAVDEPTGRALWDGVVAPLLRGGCAVLLSTHHEWAMRMPQVTRVVRVRHGGVDVEERSPPPPPPPLPLGNGHSMLNMAGDPASTATMTTTTTTTTTASEGGDDDVQVGMGEVRRAVRGMLARREGRDVDASLVAQVDAELAGAEVDWTRPSALGALISRRDFGVFWARFGASPGLLAGLGVVLLVSCALSVASPMWLAHWAESGEDGLEVFAALGALQAVAALAASVLLTLCALASSRLFHADLLRALMRATASALDASPAGRLLNVFQADLRSIDEACPDALVSQASRLLTAAAQLVVICSVAPLVLVALPLLAAVFAFILDRTRAASRDAKRIEASAHAPVLQHFLDAVRGRETLRAFGAEERFETAFASRADDMARAKCASEAVGKWAQALSTQTGCVLYLICGLAGVLSGASRGSLGLVLVYAGILQRSGMDLMMGLTSLEAAFVSVERAAAFLRLPAEADDAHGNDDVLDGSIEFRDVCFRYRLSRPLVLRGLSMRVESGSKVAVVGRTGCGKSTLLALVTRLYDVAHGQVRVGGVDVAALPLKLLRAHVRVIAQSPVLFAVSLRDNVRAATDAEAVLALKAVGLDAARIGGLDGVVGGDRLSLGERQLVVLARTLAAKPRIVLCDEATASIDPVTDRLVHDVLLGAEGCTVVSVLHRSEQLSRFDAVYRLDAGVLASVERRRA